jgi:DNA polymerase III sliding clamp (beta) subunit (PCNA family)
MITIKSSVIRSALNIAAKNDIRYYLNGLLIEAMKTETRVIATNGAIMGIYRETVENDKTESFILPRDIAAMIKGKQETVSFNLINEEKAIMYFNNQEITFAPVAGKFPDYRILAHAVWIPFNRIA